MNLAKAIEGGVVGASTLTLLQEAIHKFDRNGTPGNLVLKPGILRKIKKYEKKGKPTGKLYIDLAGQLLAAVSYFGLSGLGKKRNAVLRGGLLGLGAGVVTAFLSNQGDESEQMDVKKFAITVSSYAGAGMLAGAAVKKLQSKKKLKKKK